MKGKIMIQKCQVIFCDNEHGTGDVCFPDVSSMDAYDLRRMFIDNPNDVRSVRKAAKEAGWGRIAGADYCPGCMASM